MDLAAMLQQSGAGSPAPSGPMPPQQAVQILQKFGITERDLPIIMQAVQALMSGGGQPPEPQGAPPPSMPMPPQ